MNGHEDSAFITIYLREKIIYLREKIIAHINVNCLSPDKVRTTILGGEKKMLVWNDLEADEKIKIYDKGVDVTTRQGLYNSLVNYRSGDMGSPQVNRVEALSQELAYFVDCIGHNKTPMNDRHAGVRVVKLLEAATVSLSKRGELVYL